MDKTNKIILVTGATGRQGGATAQHLLANGWRVRALVRNPSKPASRSLQLAGAEIVQGNLDDRASLLAAIQDVYGVFSAQSFGYDAEIRQGKNIADVAKAAGVQHFIYTSVRNAEGLFRIGCNVGKWQIEQYIQEIGLPTTILRPGWFMEALIGPPLGVSHGTLALAIKPDVSMYMIAVSDIGAFATLAFEFPNEYLGKTIEIAGDALIPPQVAASISSATGRSVPYIQIPIETIRQQNAEFARVCDFVNEGNFQTDIPALRKLYPGLMRFETWLKQEGKAKFEALFNAQQA